MAEKAIHKNRLPVLTMIGPVTLWLIFFISTKNDIPQLFTTVGCRFPIDTSVSVI